MSKVNLNSETDDQVWLSFCFIVYEIIYENFIHLEFCSPTIQQSK